MLIVLPTGVRSVLLFMDRSPFKPTPQLFLLRTISLCWQLLQIHISPHGKERQKRLVLRNFAGTWASITQFLAKAQRERARKRKRA